jgi:membrane protease subunit (stomatin/prohibitin family)
MAEEKLIKFGGQYELAWKYPEGEIDDHTKVIVPANFVCLYMKDGEMLDTLEPGGHVLVEKKKLFQKRQSFLTSFLYINTESSMRLKWGTVSVPGAPALEIIDPMLEIPVSVTGYGSYVISICNPRKFGLKLGGLDAEYSADRLHDFFLDVVLSNLKMAFGQAMVEEKVSFYNIWPNMGRIANSIKEHLTPAFDMYGVKLEEFSIAQIDIPEDTREMVKDVYTSKYLKKQSKEINADEEQAAKDNDEYMKKRDEEMRKDLKDIAMAGIDADAKVGVAQGGKAAAGTFCPNCGQPIAADDKFCPHCGHKFVHAGDTCPKCGAPLKPGTRFCPVCGEKIGD